MSTDVYKINRDGVSRACSGLYTIGPSLCGHRELPVGSVDVESVMNSSQTSFSATADVTASTTDGVDLRIDTTGSSADPSFFEYVYIDSSASGGLSLIESDQTPCDSLPNYGDTNGLFDFTTFGGFNNGDLQYHKIYDMENCDIDVPVSQDVKRIDVVDIIAPDGSTPAACPLVFPFMIKDPVTPSNPDTAIANQGALDAFINGFWGGGFTYNTTTCNYERLVETTVSTPTNIFQGCDVLCSFDNANPAPGQTSSKTSEFHSEKISDSSNVDAAVDHSLVLSITEDDNGDAVTPVEIMTTTWTGVPGSLPASLDDAAFTVAFDGDFDSGLAVGQKTTLLQEFTLSHTGTKFSLTYDKQAIAELLDDGDNWIPPIAVGEVTPYSANGGYGVGWTFAYSAGESGCTVVADTQKVLSKMAFDRGIISLSMNTTDTSGVKGYLANGVTYRMYLVSDSGDPRFKTEDGTGFYQARTASWTTDKVADTQVSHILHTAVPSGAVPYTIDGGELGLIKHTSCFKEASPPYSAAHIPSSINSSKYTNGTPGVAYIYGYVEVGNVRNGKVLKSLTTNIVDIPYIDASKHSFGLPAPELSQSSGSLTYVSEGCFYYSRRLSLQFGSTVGRFAGIVPTGGTVRIIRGGTFGSPTDVVAPITERVVGGTELLNLASVSPAWSGSTLNIYSQGDTTSFELDLCPYGDKLQIEVILDWLDPTDLVTTYETAHISEYYIDGLY